MAHASYAVAVSKLRLVAFPHENGEHYSIQIQQVGGVHLTVSLHEKSIKDLVQALQAWLGSLADKKEE